MVTANQSFITTDCLENNNANSIIIMFSINLLKTKALRWKLQGWCDIQWVHTARKENRGSQERHASFTCLSILYRQHSTTNHVMLSSINNLKRASKFSIIIKYDHIHILQCQTAWLNETMSNFYSTRTCIIQVRLRSYLEYSSEFVKKSTIQANIYVSAIKQTRHVQD